MTLEPLTQEEQAFAEQRYDIVSKFLRVHRLPEADYYDVVIFGYLEAVQTHFRNPISPELQNFPALANICMKSAFLKDWKHRHRVKRYGNYTALSMDASIADTNGFTLHDVLPDNTRNLETTVETRETITAIFNAAMENEREIMSLHLSGYHSHEIGSILGITRCSVNKSVYWFRRKAVAKAQGWEFKRERAESDRRYREQHHAEILARKRAYDSAHRAEINARRRAQRAAKKAALNAPDIESGPAR